MRLTTTSIFVDNQEKALAFYTEKLGFIVKVDVPVGEFRWITLVSPDEENGTELTLEPNIHPAAKEFQEKIYSDGIPANMFGVDDIQSEFERLREEGVKFTLEPKTMDGYIFAIFDDTCGNFIQILQLID